MPVLVIRLCPTVRRCTCTVRVPLYASHDDKATAPDIGLTVVCVPSATCPTGKVKPIAVDLLVEMQENTGLVDTAAAIQFMEKGKHATAKRSSTVASGGAVQFLKSLARRQAKDDSTMVSSVVLAEWTAS